MYSQIVTRGTRSLPPAAADYRHDGCGEVAARASWPPTWRALRRIDRKLAVASLAIAVGLVLIGWAVVRGVTGDDVSQLPDAIERIAPVPDAVQVLAQSQVVVDLAEGYEGRLRIDGVDFPTLRMEDLTNDDVEPGEQVEIPPGVVFEPGNDTLTFTPGPGIEIETLRRRHPQRHGPVLAGRARRRRGAQLHLDVQRRLAAPLNLGKIRVNRAFWGRFVSTSDTHLPQMSGACRVQGRSPVSSRCSNAASSMIGTLCCSALVTFEAPGLSPTTRA